MRYILPVLLIIIIHHSLNQSKLVMIVVLQNCLIRRKILFEGKQILKQKNIFQHPLESIWIQTQEKEIDYSVEFSEAFLYYQTEEALLIITENMCQDIHILVDFRRQVEIEGIRI